VRSIVLKVESYERSYLMSCEGLYEEQFHDIEAARLSCKAERHVWQELAADQVQY
jgi:hypothetical protein